MGNIENDRGESLLDFINGKTYTFVFTILLSQNAKTKFCKVFKIEF